MLLSGTYTVFYRINKTKRVTDDAQTVVSWHSWLARYSYLPYDAPGISYRIPQQTTQNT